MKKCFGYVRVSTVKQSDGVSLEAQREAIQRFADKHDLEVIKWFEETMTAAKRGRPKFNSMITGLRKGHASGIIVHKIDRSARNFTDWAKIGELADTGTDIYFAAESFDYHSRGGRLSADIQAVIASDYIRNLREEIKKSQRILLRNGLYPFAAPPGYLDSGKGAPKTIDPVRGPLIKRAFELYDSGQYSIRSLTKEMKALNLRNRFDRPMTKTSIENMLRNPFYYGVVRIRRTGEVYQGKHEPLISAQLFERVQDRKAGRTNKKVTRHNHTYRGLFRCGHCRSAMTPELQKGHVYYRCHTGPCPSKSVREESIERQIADLLLRAEFNDEHICAIEKAVENWGHHQNNLDASKTYSMQLQQIEDRITKLDDAAIDRIIDKDTHQSRMKVLLTERIQITELMDKSSSNGSNQELVASFLERVKSLAQHYISADAAEKREIVEIATSNRLVKGRSVYLEPANWLCTAQKLVHVLSSPPHRTTSRTPHHSSDDTIGQLVELATSPEVTRIGRKLSNSNEEPIR